MHDTGPDVSSVTTHDHRRLLEHGSLDVSVVVAIGNGLQISIPHVEVDVVIHDSAALGRNLEVDGAIVSMFRGPINGTVLILEDHLEDIDHLMVDGSGVPMLIDLECEFLELDRITCTAKLIRDVFGRPVVAGSSRSPVVPIRGRDSLQGLDVAKWAVLESGSRANVCSNRDWATMQENGCGQYSAGAENEGQYVLPGAGNARLILGSRKMVSLPKG